MTHDKVIRRGEIVQDDWTYALDGEAYEAGQKVIVTLERFLAEKADLLEVADSVGVLLLGADDPRALVEHFDALGAIAVDFPKFTDGRGYSHARMLRDRHGWSGELRAHGDVLRDQALYMVRCGFDVLELRKERDLEGALEAFEEFSVKYLSLIHI